MTTEDLIGIILAMAYPPSDQRAIFAVGIQLGEFRLSAGERQRVAEELRTWRTWQGPGAIYSFVTSMRDEQNYTRSTPGWQPPDCAECQDTGFVRSVAAHTVRRCLHGARL
jgi:hypothetical protein